MPLPRTMGMGLTLACADQENIEWRLVSAIISSAVIAVIASVAVMTASYASPGPTARATRADRSRSLPRPVTRLSSIRPASLQRRKDFLHVTEPLVDFRTW